MQGVSRQKSNDDYKVLCGSCPDEQCRAKLFFPAYDKSVECTGCGKRHEQSSLQNIAEVTNPSVALHNILKNILLGNVKPKKGTDDVKVLGLSNYVCKSISPILTCYGMDKRTGKAKPLIELSQHEIFDCGKILGGRAFLIEEENLEVIGYGRDRSGSVKYLADILNEIRLYNNNEECLIPIHADGDGHCLVHAVSRALVGRELFWHALRLNLADHFKTNVDRYKEHFRDFIDTDEWDSIIEECDPDFIPCDGEPLGLRNIHVFGLANVLHRPVILLDSYKGMQSSGDYSGVFLPALVEPEACRSQDGPLNKPICIAWSSPGRNHYIPLVGIKGRKLPKLPRSMIQRAWGVPSDMIDKYIEFDEAGNCRVGGDKCLSDKYIRQLVTAMEEVFVEKNGVPPQLVADVHQYLYKSSGKSQPSGKRLAVQNSTKPRSGQPNSFPVNGKHPCIVGSRLDNVIETTKMAIEERVLYRCLTCEALIRYHLPLEWFRKGGSLYNLAIKSHKTLMTNKKYFFPFQGVTCMYDKEKDTLIPDKATSRLKTCSFCQGDNVRLVNANGGVQYFNGDRTAARSASGRCACGFKHYWDGKEYDNIPEIFPVSLQWNGRVVEEKVAWFQYETDPTMNSNVFEVAQKLVQKHFPGEFGSERLVQQVVDTILRQTANRESAEDDAATGSQDVDMGEDPLWSSDTASKIILTGYKQKTMHKEELTRSEKEKMVKKQVEENAPKQQQRRTKEIAAMATKSSPKKSKPDLTAKRSADGRGTPVPMETTSTTTKTSQRKVRVATSDGRQVMLTLEKDLTFGDLQQMIQTAVNVPPKRQKIRVGFPPKELKPPADSDRDQIINLQHGDKIALEVLPDPVINTGRSKSLGALTTFSAPSRAPRTSWSHFEEDTHTATADALLQSLREAQDANDTLDASIASMAIMATIAGKDLWTQTQSMPHLFSVGGLFYKQVERDLGLVDGKHCQLPSIPGKVFRFNAKEDRLELCMEPYGHFPVEPGVERRVAELKEAEEKIRFGSSGAVEHGTKMHAAFSGEGHSLQTMNIERMPQDLATLHHHGHHSNTARKMHSLCDPNKHQAAIPEESAKESSTEEDNSDGISASGETTDVGKVGVGYQKLGPGYSVIDPNVTNKTNQSVHFFKVLADSIEKSMQEIDEEMERIDDEEERKRSCSTDLHGNDHKECPAVGESNKPQTMEATGSRAVDSKSSNVENNSKTESVNLIAETPYETVIESGPSSNLLDTNSSTVVTAAEENIDTEITVPSSGPCDASSKEPELLPSTETLSGGVGGQMETSIMGDHDERQNIKIEDAVSLDTSSQKSEETMEVSSKQSHTASQNVAEIVQSEMSVSQKCLETDDAPRSTECLNTDSSPLETTDVVLSEGEGQVMAAEAANDSEGQNVPEENMET